MEPAFAQKETMKVIFTEKSSNQQNKVLQQHQETVNWDISNKDFEGIVQSVVNKLVSSNDLNSIVKSLDNSDPCAAHREQFVFPKAVEGREVSYLLGNSLGLQPLALRDMVNNELDRWQDLGINGYFKGATPWMDLDKHALPHLARLVGAKSESEVAVMNSVSVNLHLLMTRFYRPTATKFKILVENKPFPSDYYAVESQIRARGLKVEDCLVEMPLREGEFTLRTEDIIAKIQELGDSLAVVCFGGVQYYTGQFFDIGAITAAAHEVNAYSLIDCAHATGNVALKLHEWQVDGACWCSYKYLNSGPGGIGGLFLHEKHHNDTSTQLLGWWGHTQETRFKMDNKFVPAVGAASMRISHVPVMSATCHLASLKIFAAADLKLLRNKSLLLTTLLHTLLSNNAVISEYMTIITPSAPSERGCQLSLLFHDDQPDAEVSKTKRLHSFLEARNIITDYRHPNVIRVAPTPLYCQFQDVAIFASALEEGIVDIFNEPQEVAGDSAQLMALF
eukprot:gene36063-44473_t